MLNKNGCFKFSVIFSICVTLSFLTTQVSGNTVITYLKEDFNVNSINDLQGWLFEGYDSTKTSALTSIEQNFTINNGKLEASWNFGFRLDRASINSSVAFGRWSYDWMASNTENSLDAFEFLLKDFSSQPNNLNGRSFKIPDYYAGYALLIKSYGDSSPPSISLMKFHNDTSTAPITIKSYNFASPLSGNHNIEITRDFNSEFMVKFDSVQRLKVKDETYKISDKFSFLSIEGNSSIDNLIIEDYGKPPESSSLNINSLELFITIPLIASKVLFKRKRRNNR